MRTTSADGFRVAAPQTLAKPPVKRNRIQLSCTHCRNAKLKCDRENPCSQCVKRGRSSLCAFLPPVARKRPAKSMQNRLNHLENLVRGAMTSQPSDESVDPAGISQAPLLDVTSKRPNDVDTRVSDASGRVVPGPNDTTYVGATHWAAILDDIEEVRGYFSETGEDHSLGVHQRVRPDLSLLFNNTTSPATRDDLLSALPERNTVNKLVSRYFNSNSPALREFCLFLSRELERVFTKDLPDIIHKPTFQKNYKKFWANPRNSPVGFLALLYAIMCLATFAALGDSEENTDTDGNSTETIKAYRGCCAQCLALSNCANNPGPYVLETYLIYMEIEFVLSKGDQRNCYLIVGVAVRLALRMGYHRDSDKIKGSITPYQGEMRRRVWHLLVQMDLLVSFHNGLPSMVQAVNSDTRIPLNLQDQDFDEESTKLPPSRPETEMTGMSYTLAKGRLARVLAKIIEQANSLVFSDYVEVTALDQELRQAYDAVPPFLRLVPIDLCITDSAELIIRRFSLAVLFQKSRCMLHRKYLMKEKENREFSDSKTAAINASRELLRIQSEVHDAVQPGGVLCKELWVVSSLAIHDLLLAAVIIYLVLIQESVGVTALGGKQTPTTRQTEMIGALKGSRRIWFEMISMAVDAKKAHGVLDNILKRLNSVFAYHQLDSDICAGVDDATRYDTGESIRTLALNEPTLFSENPVLGDLREEYNELGDAAPFVDLPTQSDVDFGSISMDIFGEMTDIPMDFDWDIFDNNVRQTHVDDQSWPDISLQNFDCSEQNQGL